jgi:predicted nucleotidyltransferase
MTLPELKKLLSENEERLTALHVKSLSVFGSVVRGESTSTSDVDLLVEFSLPVSLFEFLDVKYFLEELLSSEVDLATEKALHPALKENILREAVRVA